MSSPDFNFLVNLIYRCIINSTPGSIIEHLPMNLLPTFTERRKGSIFLAGKWVNLGYLSGVGMYADLRHLGPGEEYM